MYLPTSEACDSPNGLQNPTAQLAAMAADVAADAALMNGAQSAFDSLLSRSPGDFVALGPGVAKDVAVVNNDTGAARGGVNNAAGGSGSNVGSGGGSCDINPQGGCNVLPLNGPQPLSAKQISAVPQLAAIPLRTNQGVQLPGLGRYGGTRSRIARPGGLGQCCTGLPEWGDAYPSGAPSPSGVQSILSWTMANPLLALGIAFAGIWIASESQKGGRRG